MALVGAPVTRGPNPLYVAAVATSALLLAFTVAFCTDTETPPATGNPPVDLPDRVADASRSGARTTPPTPRVAVVRATHSPASNQDRDTAGEAHSVAPSQGLDAGDLPPLLLLIRDHESGGDYQAFNPTGCEGYGCGGAFQLHARYAATWAAEAGFDGLSSQAQTWPPAIQDAVALFKFNATGGRLWCDWTEYC